MEQKILYYILFLGVNMNISSHHASFLLLSSCFISQAFISSCCFSKYKKKRYGIHSYEAKLDCSINCPVVFHGLSWDCFLNCSTLEKKGVVRNLLRVPRIVTNSKPFLGFVPIRFRTRPIFTIEKKGFVQDCFFYSQEKGAVNTVS